LDSLRASAVISGRVVDDTAGRWVSLLAPQVQVLRVLDVFKQAVQLLLVGCGEESFALRMGTENWWAEDSKTRSQFMLAEDESKPSSIRDSQLRIKKPPRTFSQALAYRNLSLSLFIKIE
jgi:hypothetical protein